MCSPFAHTLAGYAIIALAEPQVTFDLRSNWKAMGAGLVFGCMPDADFLVAYYTNIPALQHHYFSHSIPFVFVIGIITFLLLKPLIRSRALKWTILLTAAYASHLLLDYFTYDGSMPIGIPLYWPFTDKHYVAPFEIFLSIHRGGMETLFGAHNFLAVFREALIFIPIALIVYFHGRNRSRQPISATKFNAMPPRREDS
jgi:inner membrane protein